jgi:hypothetical protein
VARGPGGGDALGAAPEAARERAGPALAGAPELRRRRAPRARARLPLRDQQVAGDGHVLEGRAPRAAAERGRKTVSLPPEAACR